MARLFIRCFQLSYLNPLPPSDAVRQQKKYFRGSFKFSIVTIYHPSGNLKFNYLDIFQSLKWNTLMVKILSIPLKLNFTPNTLGGYGLN